MNLVLYTDDKASADILDKHLLHLLTYNHCWWAGDEAGIIHGW